MKKTMLALAMGLMTLMSVEAFARDSFRQSCQVIRETPRRIEAYCKDVRGNMVYNDFRRGNCRSVGNNNGRLVCEDSGNGGQQLPPGSYIQSCSSCDVRRNVLSCICQDKNGRGNRTSLELRFCRGPVANDDGHLTCQ